MWTLFFFLTVTHIWALDVFWDSHGYSNQGTRYSPLKDLNVDNVNQLVVTWKYSLKSDEVGGHGQATPLVVDDGNGRAVLVFCTQFNKVVALDPTTGIIIWTQNAYNNTKYPRTDYYCRGVSSWLNPSKKDGDPCRRTIFMATLDFLLVSLDAATGFPCPDFGPSGSGSVFVLEDEQSVDPLLWDLRNPPVVVNGVVAISPRIAEDGEKNITTKGPTWAFYAANGTRLWTFHPIPFNQSDPAYKTWENGTENIGGGNTWPIMSGDNTLNLIFMPVGSAAPDMYGGGRIGENLYTSSIVAVDALNGSIRWSFQIVMHDIWDMDVACQPSISKIGNRTVVIVGTKAAMVWMFDAETGEPIPEAKSISVPPSDVPGEISSPTQLIPGNVSLLLLPLTINESLIWGPNPDEEEYCLNWFHNLTGGEGGKMFTPFSLRGSVLYPTTSGGINWGGCAFNPEKGTYTCVVKNNIAASILIRQGDPIPKWCKRTLVQKGSPYTYCDAVMTSRKGHPCIKYPWSELVMLDMNTFTVKWRSTLGFETGSEFIRGWGSITQTGGVMQTQGGLLFVTGTSDKNLFGFSAETGKLIFSSELPWTAFMTPITYMIKDKQYIVVLSTNGTHGEVIAYALPPIVYDWDIIFGATFGGLGFCTLVVLISAFLRKHQNSKGYTRITH